MTTPATKPPTWTRRPAQTPFNHDRYSRIETRSPVCVRHPGYATGSNTLLTFASSDGDDTYHGVDFRMVHTACAIIADNRYDGWLSHSDDPAAEKIALDNGALLAADDYYFHVPFPVRTVTANNSGHDANPPAVSHTAPPALPPVQQNSKAYLYPVTPNFRSWTYAEDANLATAWTSAIDQIAVPPRPTTNVAANVAARDSTCRWSASGLMTELAHIVPAAERDWFARNRMDKYRSPGSRSGQEGPDTEQNIMLLRADVHALWDKRHFNLVPKFAEGSWTLIAHTMESSSELHEQFHNTSLQPLRGISPRYLFARFAYNLFPAMIGFLCEGKPRFLAVCNTNGSEDRRWFSKDECQRLCENQGQGRSVSPKRKRSEQEKATDDECFGFDSGVSDIGSHNSECPAGEVTGDLEQTLSYQDWDDPFGRKRARDNDAIREALGDDGSRGRKRRRKCSAG